MSRKYHKGLSSEDEVSPADHAMDSELLTPDSEDNTSQETLRNSSQGSSQGWQGRNNSRPPVSRPLIRERQYREDSFGESLSTIPLADSSLEVKQVYQELQDINKQLKREFKLLRERESLVKEKEQLLAKREATISADKAEFEDLVVAEVERRVAAREQEHKIALEKYEITTREKNKELKRLKESFDTVKTANDALRKELETVQSNQVKLERQSTSLQARLSHLQRRQQLGDSKDEVQETPQPAKPVPAKKDSAKDTKSKSKSVCLGTYDVLAILLEWVSEVHLWQMVNKQPTKPLECLNNPLVIQDKCLKVLPSIVELVRELPNQKPSLVLPVLQFIYWCLLQLDNLQAQQKISLSSSLRRVGEELYKARTVKFSDESQANPDEGSSRKEAIFFKSSNLHMRLLSSLIILRTLTQVDLLAHVLEVVKSDLKYDKSRELFLYYQATLVLIPFLKPSNKGLVNLAVDIMLQMSMESSLLPQFLQTCSGEAWFRAASYMFRNPNTDEKQVEKLSIILQKLSKIRSNKRFFESFGMINTVNEMLRTPKNDNAFLTLNLKSILFNLNTKMSLPTQSTEDNTSVLSSFSSHPSLL